MMRLLLLTLLFILQLSLNDLVADHPTNLTNWKSNAILQPTEKKPARTAVLIIAPPAQNDSPFSQRWELGKKVWEEYMNSHPCVDCYFIQGIPSNKEDASSNQVWIEGNTIYIADWWLETHVRDRILHKTICAMELLLPNYTHFIRTNVNTFLNLKSVNEYMENHHQSMYTATLWQNEWYTIGYGIIYTADVAAHIAREYRRLEAIKSDLIDCYHADDCNLTSLATGVFPFEQNHPYRCCPSLPFGIRQLMCDKSLTTMHQSQYGTLLFSPISFESAMNYCIRAPDTMMLYRIRTDINLKDLARLYEYLLVKHYPEINCTDLVQVVESWP